MLVGSEQAVVVGGASCSADVPVIRLLLAVNLWGQPPQTPCLSPLWSVLEKRRGSMWPASKTCHDRCQDDFVCVLLCSAGSAVAWGLSLCMLLLVRDGLF